MAAVFGEQSGRLGSSTSLSHFIFVNTKSPKPRNHQASKARQSPPITYTPTSAAQSQPVQANAVKDLQSAQNLTSEPEEHHISEVLQKFLIRKEAGASMVKLSLQYIISLLTSNTEIPHY